jgi:hypothetical protein
MDYPEDDCLTNFTTDQNKRMMAMYNKLRKDSAGTTLKGGDEVIDTSGGTKDEH